MFGGSKTKRTFSTELAYVFGIVFVAWGVVLMEKADFGVSMVVAPAYLLYRWLSPAWSFVTFAMAEYCLQAVLLLAMCLLLRRFRVSYLFSFVTAVVYGVVLDAFMLLGTRNMPLIGSTGIMVARAKFTTVPKTRRGVPLLLLHAVPMLSVSPRLACPCSSCEPALFL